LIRRFGPGFDREELQSEPRGFDPNTFWISVSSGRLSVAASAKAFELTVKGWDVKKIG
jgi:hypothetical protein